MDFPKVPCPLCGSSMTSTQEDLLYEECGLPYVVLKNIYTERCENQECGNILRTIPKMAELHRLLALPLIKKGPTESVVLTYDDEGWHTEWRRITNTVKNA